MLKFTIVDKFSAMLEIPREQIMLAVDPDGYSKHIRKELEFRAGFDFMNYLKDHNTPVTVKYNYLTEMIPYRQTIIYRLDLLVLKVTEEEN